MAINTELPISKVTFDDQEISLVSSGGGSEEDMKIVSEVHYGSSNMTTFYNRVRELIQNNKLLYVKLLVGAVRSSSAKNRVTLNTAGGMSFSSATGIMKQIPYFYYPAAMGDDFITLAGKSSNIVNSSLYLKSGTYVMWYANGFYFTETAGITMDYMSASLNMTSDEFTIYYFE